MMTATKLGQLPVFRCGHARTRENVRINSKGYQVCKACQKLCARKWLDSLHGKMLRAEAKRKYKALNREKINDQEKLRYELKPKREMTEEQRSRVRANQRARYLRKTTWKSPMSTHPFPNALFADGLYMIDSRRNEPILFEYNGHIKREMLLLPEDCSDVLREGVN